MFTLWVEKIILFSLFCWDYFCFRHKAKMWRQMLNSRYWQRKRRKSKRPKGKENNASYICADMYLCHCQLGDIECFWWVSVSISISKQSHIIYSRVTHSTPSASISAYFEENKSSYLQSMCCIKILCQYHYVSTWIKDIVQLVKGDKHGAWCQTGMKRNASRMCHLEMYGTTWGVLALCRNLWYREMAWQVILVTVAHGRNIHYLSRHLKEILVWRMVINWAENICRGNFVNG